MARFLPGAAERPQKRSRRLRTFAWLLVSVTVLTWAGLELGCTATRPEVNRYEWRRMAGGWERIASWRPPARADEPAVHPLLLASLELTASLVALSGAATD